MVRTQEDVVMSRPRFEFDEFLADPFGTLQRARETGGLVDLNDQTTGVVHHETVRALLSDPRLRANFVDFLRTFGVSEGPFFEWMKISPLNRDGADHQRFRALMARTFTPRSVERLRPYLRTAANDLIDGFATRGHCDFVAEFADIYPSLGLCELIGVPMEDRDRFRGWANTIGLGFSPFVGLHIAAVDAALSELLAYTAELAKQRRVEPKDDLVSRIAAAAAEDGWSDFEASGFIAGLVFAGHDTTKNQLGWTVATLAEHPDVWDAVGDGTRSAQEVVEEVLRHRSAVTGVGRTAVEPVPVGDDTIQPGEQVFFSVWSANHDAKVFAHPDELRVGQSAESGHFAFGHGAHFCLGAALARAELQDALVALTARITVPVLGPDAAWRPPAGINGPDRLPITFSARPAAQQAAGG
jgi:cytochrome P450